MQRATDFHLPANVDVRTYMYCDLLDGQNDATVCATCLRLFVNTNAVI